MSNCNVRPVQSTNAGFASHSAVWLTACMELGLRPARLDSLSAPSQDGDHPVSCPSPLSRPIADHRCSLAHRRPKLLPPAEPAAMGSLTRSATCNAPQSTCQRQQQRAVAAAAAAPRRQWRPSQQQRRHSLIVRAQELEEIDPITGEVIAGTAMATAAGQRVEAGEVQGAVALAVGRLCACTGCLHRCSDADVMHSFATVAVTLPHPRRPSTTPIPCILHHSFHAPLHEQVASHLPAASSMPPRR